MTPTLPNTPPPALGPDDVEVVEKSTPYDGYFRMDVYRLRHRLFAGGWSDEMTREVFERRHAVSVLPYDPDRDEVVLIEQFRIGAYAALASDWFGDRATPWLTECVAGIIEKGEDPEDVARREALEETGLAMGDIVPVCHYLASSGGSSESVFAFCGRVDATGAGGIHGLPGEHEDIRVFAAPAADAFRMLDAGRIVSALAVVPLQWLRLNRDRLRERWRAAAEGA